MRLWHVDLLHYLPKSQLLAQWRELNSIFKKQDKHILINYIYKYRKEYLRYYSGMVISEFNNRGYKYNLDNYNKYFEGVPKTKKPLCYDEHDSKYLTICYYNLYEKYLRGQKDFTLEVWEELDRFYKEKINGRH